MCKSIFRINKLIKISTSYILLLSFHLAQSATANPTNIYSVDGYINGTMTIPAGNTTNIIPQLPKPSLENRLGKWIEKLNIPTDNRTPYNEEQHNKVIEIIDKELITYLKNIPDDFNNDEFSIKKELKIAGKLYGIDPIHIIAAIVGEHSFNVSFVDKMQTLAFKSGQWKLAVPERNELLDVINLPQMDACRNEYKKRWELFNCYEQVWFNQIAGKNVNGKTYPYKGFIGGFFDPTLGRGKVNIGSTYGLGQMSPYKAFVVADYVNAISGFPDLSLNKNYDIYESVLDPKKTIHYIAALMRKTIDTYKHIAHFDISKNPGLTSTLYNLGNEINRAQALYDTNIRNLKDGKDLKTPSVNYMGWYINARLPLIRAAFGL